MNKCSILYRLYPINGKKLVKQVAICISAALIVSMIATLSPINGQTTTQTSALHTSGRQIIDANGNVVYLRGMGIAGMAPDLILWGSNATDNWNVQWNNDPSVMDQNFEALQKQWHVNMIRVFIYPSWYYRDNIAPSQEDLISNVNAPISTRAYLRTLCQEADKYGIYVDIVPYMLTPSTSSFGKDPYATPNFGWQGLPMMGWDEAAQRFLNDAGYGTNEQGFWTWFWTDIANNLKDYNNVIFEAWNEPGWNGGDIEPIPTGYMNYLQTMYNSIRSTGAQNIIMMQWRMGWSPNNYGGTLSWVTDVHNTIHPTNLVYTTHFYYYAPTDLTMYWAKDYTTLKAQVQTAIDSMGITAPLVINEEGSCTAKTPNRANDNTWWQNLILAQRDLGVGACAYYWISDGGLGSVYAGEAMLSGGYAPNDMGQSYINAYNGTTTIPAPTSTVTPTSSIAPQSTPQPTATLPPTALTVDTAQQVVDSTSTMISSATPSPTPPPSTAPTVNADPTDVPAPSKLPIQQHFKIVLYWSPFYILFWNR